MFSYFFCSFFNLILSVFFSSLNQFYYLINIFIQKVIYNVLQKFSYKKIRILMERFRCKKRKLTHILLNSIYVFQSILQRNWWVNCLWFLFFFHLLVLYKLLGLISTFNLFSLSIYLECCVRKKFYKKVFNTMYLLKYEC